MQIWKFFHLPHIPTNTKLTIWYEHSYPIIFYEYNQSVYRTTLLTTELLFSNTSLLRTTHLDMYHHHLGIHSSTTIRLYEISTLNLINECETPVDLMPLVVTRDTIVYRYRYGAPTYYCLNWNNDILYTHTIPGTLLTYAHTIPADYYIYKDKILIYSNGVCTTYKLPFWLSAATVNFILTVPYCWGVTENGRIFVVNLWKLFASNVENLICPLSVYTYLPRSYVGLDVWSSEDVSVVCVSNALLKKAEVIQKSDRLLSFPVLYSGPCGGI